MRLYPLLFILLLNFLVVSCDNGLQGDLNENLPPNTSLTLNDINLPEGERLVSQVNISWWADDPDGYVAGYEFYIGDPAQASDEDWTFTERTDSTFILPIPPGNEEANVQFNVRAIDNDDARDPEPPSLTFPIRNTPPSVSFTTNETPPDTTYRIASFGFIPDDPDGQANLNRVEIALNDTSEGSWKEIDLDVSFITFRVDDTQADPTASVMLGRSATESDIEFETVNVNGENEFFVRAIDNAEAVSNVISHDWYVKEQTSRILFLNDYFTNTQEKGQLHLGKLEELGITQVDYLDISDGQALGGTRVPLTQAFPDRSLAEPTINMMLAEWDYIYWISNDLDRNIGYALEITDQFFDEGGRMFINIPIEFLADRNSLFQFLPFRGVEEADYDDPEGRPRSENYVIQRCTEVSITEEATSLQDDENIYTPQLRLAEQIFPAYSILPFSGSINLFEANFNYWLRNPLEFLNYDGNQLISTMTPDRSILYFGIDLDAFTTEEDNPCETPESTDENEEFYPPSDLTSLIEFMTIETLGFEQ